MRAKHKRNRGDDRAIGVTAHVVRYHATGSMTLPYCRSPFSAMHRAYTL